MTIRVQHISCDQGSRAGGARAEPYSGRHRQPVGEDDGGRWPRGYDAGKKINGRKRHLLVDTMGLLIAAIVARD
jgi:hypothetical protein